MNKESEVRDYPKFESKLRVRLNDLGKWKEVLSHLGISLKKCDAELRNSIGDSNEAFFKCLLHWVDLNVEDTKGTWSELFVALRKGGEAGAAVDLEKDIFSSECTKSKRKQKDKKTSRTHQPKSKRKRIPPHSPSPEEDGSSESDEDTPSPKRKKCSKSLKHTKGKSKKNSKQGKSVAISSESDKEESNSDLSEDDVRRFLKDKNVAFHKYMRDFCDVKSIASSLLRMEAIKSGTSSRLNAAPTPEEAADIWFDILFSEGSVKKLQAMSEALKEDSTRESHQKLAKKIDDFLLKGGIVHARTKKTKKHPATVKPAAEISLESSGTFNENVKVVLLTANGNERETVRNFFGISSKIKNEKVKSYTYKNDPVLNGLEVEVKQEYAGNLTFDMINFGSIKVVHMKIGTSYGKDKARTAVRAILEVANVRNWPLEIIFCVGCCGCSSKDKSQNANYRGNVLLSQKAGSYTNKFKGKKLSFKNINTYDMDETWFQRLGQPQDCQDHIHTTKADCIYSGDTVMAEENSADELRGYHNYDLIGIEMEGCGIAHELRSWDKSRVSELKLPKDMRRDSFLVVKGVSDHAGSDKTGKHPTNFFGQSTDRVDDDQRQEIATLHSVALVCRALSIIAKVD